MATRYPKKQYKFIKGKDWVYDRIFFDVNPFDEVSAPYESVTIMMTEPEYKSLEVIRKQCHAMLGDDYLGPMPIIDFEGESE